MPRSDDEIFSQSECDLMEEFLATLIPRVETLCGFKMSYPEIMVANVQSRVAHPSPRPWTGRFEDEAARERRHFTIWILTCPDGKYCPGDIVLGRDDRSMEERDNSETWHIGHVSDPSVLDKLFERLKREIER
jgi:hypothetical protein